MERPEDRRSRKGYYLVSAISLPNGVRAYGQVRHSEHKTDYGLFIAQRTFPRIADEIERGRQLVPQGWYKHHKGPVYWVVDVAYFMNADKDGALGVVYYPRLKRHDWFFRPMEGEGGWAEPIKVRGVEKKRFTPFDGGPAA